MDRVLRKGKIWDCERENEVEESGANLNSSVFLNLLYYYVCVCSSEKPQTHVRIDDKVQVAIL
jgi:hypothetical protein